ncbi:ribonuclease R [Thioalkalivibrio sulfidiphilus]|uniref:ribonuclease R n=1 Tax=Thioalkalivibrio sulfidiphilus TaxID=1033854 RepID=UPI00037722D8|nr:ribonuclease R [Thioalkalivibrio sulfidiphilus]
MTKKHKKTPQDPQFEREAAKYERPIPSRELILEVIHEADGPVPFEPLAQRLGLTEDVDLEALTRRLRAMERDGQLVCNRVGAYLPVNQEDLVRGRVIGHPDGFGFLVPDEGGDDLFLSPRQMKSLLHGDRAVARVVGVDRRGRREGAIIEVLERNTEQVVGRLFSEGGIGFVTPDNKRITQDILIPPEAMGGAREGQIVIAAIREQPTKRTRPIGEIVEVLGEHMAPGMEIDVAIRAHGLPFQWPEEVIEAADKLGARVSPAAKKGRLDLRDMPLVTIDGEDSRDFDDAVYCEPLEKGGWRLWVAIADVSHYVTPGDPLDKEARHRATSVYFPERVIPMLPEVLSNGLCSLNPDVDRLCLVCEMQITSRGRIKDYTFHEGLMRSHARLTYTKVAGIVLDRDAELHREYARLVPHLEELHALYKVLRKARDKRGAIDFETTETKIIFGADRKIERIVPYERNDAHKIIEECMIAANVAAAKYLKKHKIPALYRVHPGPKPEKVEALRAFLGELGLSLGGGEEPQPKDYTLLLEQVRERPDAHLIQTVLLRSLKQAVYSPEDVGHFGLAHDDYAHYTSPIRRYPDLLVHRAIRHVLRGGKATDFHYSHDEMVVLGEHCSMAERRADEASWDVEGWLKCEFMQDKVGETFDGVITSVTSFGLFVELKDIYVEGLVHVTSLSNDFYHFDPVGHRMIGERGGRVYRMGDPIRVQVARVNLDERKIDFVPAEDQAVVEAPEGGRRGRRRGGKAAETAPAAEEAGEKKKAKRRKRKGKSAPAAEPAPVVEEADAKPAKKKRRSRKKAGAKPEPAAPAAPSGEGEPAKKRRRRRSGRRSSR